MSDEWHATRQIDGSWDVNYVTDSGHLVVLAYGLTEQVARQISASVEMLNALEEFIAMFPTTPGTIGDEVKQSARAAAAKATGAIST